MSETTKKKTLDDMLEEVGGGRAEAFAAYVRRDPSASDVIDYEAILTLIEFDEVIVKPLREHLREELIEGLVDAALEQQAEKAGVDVDNLQDEHVEAAIKVLGTALLVAYAKLGLGVPLGELDKEVAGV